MYRRSSQRRHQTVPNGPVLSQFTLLEVLVATTILSLVVVCIMTTFATGLKAYKAGEQKGYLVQQARGGLRLLGQDLENMIPVTDQYFDCNETGMTFLASQRSRSPGGLFQITYDGSGDKLTRIAVAVNSDSPTSSAPVLRAVETIRFEYLLDGEWVDHPREEEVKIPAVVRVTCNLEHRDSEGMFQTAFRLPQPRSKENKDNSRERTVH